MNKSFSEIWIVVIAIVFIAGGIFAWQYFRWPKEEIKVLQVKVPERTIQPEETVKWETYKEERHNGNLYIVKEFGEARYNPATGVMEGYIRELWRCNEEGKCKKLFSPQKGMMKIITDFSIHPKERFIAIEIASPDTLIIVELESEKVKFEASVSKLLHPDFSEEEPSKFEIDLVGWSNNGKSFWGGLWIAAYPQELFKIDVTNWEITKYNLSQLYPLNSKEFRFNLNMERIIYTDAPTCFDFECVEDFQKSKLPVNIYLYDLNSQKKEIIDTSFGEWFNPAWLDDYTLEYTKNNQRIEKKIF